MGRHFPPIAIAGFALLVLTSSCGQSPLQPVSQSPANPAAPDTVTPLATVTQTDLGTLGGARSFATDVNDAGTVVGWSQTAAGIDHAFSWTAAGMVDLGTLPGDQWSRALSITNSGDIVGVSGGSGTGSSIGTPVLWDRSGSATVLPIPLLPGAGWMGIADRSASGQVVGSDYGGSIPTSHAWVWSELLGIHDITADIPRAYETYGTGSNESGLVVGTYQAGVCGRVPECWHGFTWSSLSGYRDIGIPTGYDVSFAQVTGSALTDGGMVVGWTSSVGPYAGAIQPFKWTDQKGFTILPTFCNCGNAQSANSIGTVVGSSSGAAAWPAAGGIVKLSPDAVYTSTAVAINVSGLVVGWSVLDGNTVPAIHATLWKLEPGRGVDPPMVSIQSSTADLSAARAGSLVVPSGPAGCLSDTRALISKQLLIDCIVSREN
jgi:probable HAF family extracellular repeat protein